MSLHPAMASTIDAARSRAGALLDRARDETGEQVARFSGRGADWVEEAGQVLGDSAANLAAHLTVATGAHATRLADRVAGVVDRWSRELGDRLVRVGEELSDAPRDRD